MCAPEIDICQEAMKLTEYELYEGRILSPSHTRLFYLIKINLANSDTCVILTSRILARRGQDYNANAALAWNSFPFFPLPPFFSTCRRCRLIVSAI